MCQRVLVLPTVPAIVFVSLVEYGLLYPPEWLRRKPPRYLYANAVSVQLSPAMISRNHWGHRSTPR